MEKETMSNRIKVYEAEAVLSEELKEFVKNCDKEETKKPNYIMTSSWNNSKDRPYLDRNFIRNDEKIIAEDDDLIVAKNTYSKIYVYFKETEED